MKSTFPTHALVVHDDRGSADYYRDLLGYFQIGSDSTSSLSQAVWMVEVRRYALILLDEAALAREPEALDWLVQQGPHLPIVLMRDPLAEQRVPLSPAWDIADIIHNPVVPSRLRRALDHVLDDESLRLAS